MFIVAVTKPGTHTGEDSAARLQHCSTAAARRPEKKSQREERDSFSLFTSKFKWWWRPKKKLARRIETTRDGISKTQDPRHKTQETRNKTKDGGDDSTSCRAGRNKTSGFWISPDQTGRRTHWESVAGCRQISLFWIGSLLSSLKQCVGLESRFYAIKLMASSN